MCAGSTAFAASVRAADPRLTIVRLHTSEIENAIDSALRLRLISEERLTAGCGQSYRRASTAARLSSMLWSDAGGHSRLERKFLALVGRAALPRPRLQVTYRSGTRVVARVDAEFPGDLIVEVAGTRRTRATSAAGRRAAADRTDAARQTMLTFTYEDVTERPNWVTARIREALSGRVA
jgi:hypothetical protein